MDQERLLDDAVDRLLLSTATSVGNVGTFRWDLASDRMTLSERAQDILHVQGTPTAEHVIDAAVHPGDRDRAHKLRERSRAAAEQVPPGEWQMLGSGERMRWVAMTMAPASAGGRPGEMVGSVLDVTERHLYKDVLAALASNAEPEALAERLIAALDAGAHSLSAEAEQAVRIVASSRTGVQAGSGGGGSPLTVRETEVLELASHGGSSAEIAGRLALSTSTVKTHFEHIYAKLGVAERAGAVAEAMRRGLIS